MQLANIYNFDLDPRLSQFNQYFEASYSDSTKRNFFSSIRHFESWGGTLPATAHMVCLYLKDFAPRLKFKTIQSRIHSIKLWHRAKNLPDPTDSLQVKHMMRGIRKLHVTKTRKANPLTYDDLLKINKTLELSDMLVDLRNLALFTIGFFGAFRRSELVGIKYEDLTFTDQGVTIFILKSKTDQHGVGATVCIPYGNNEICPIRVLNKWLEITEIKSGFLFRKILRHDYLGDTGITPQIVNLALKQITKRAGIEDVDGFSAHSLRRGFATTASMKGSSIPSIMRQGRWVNTNSVMGYIDEAAKFNDNAASAILA